MTIIVCGYKTCGKTTIGQALAQALKWDFIDTDDLVFALAQGRGFDGTTTAELYQCCGDKQFRLWEKEAIAELQPKAPTVIASGGGAVLDADNVQHLKTLGRLIYLQIKDEQLLERLQDATLQLHDTEGYALASWQTYIESRRHLYERAVDVVLDITDLNISDAVTKLISDGVQYGEQ